MNPDLESSSCVAAEQPGADEEADAFEGKGGGMIAGASSLHASANGIRAAAEIADDAAVAEAGVAVLLLGHALGYHSSGSKAGN